MTILQPIIDNILYIILGLLIIAVLLTIISNRLKPKPDPVLEAFFAKYNIDLDNDVEADHKIKDIADINSSYPDEDKKIAQALIRFMNELNSNSNF